MTEQENLQSVIQGYQQFGQGDMEAVLSNFADDAELIYPGSKAVCTVVWEGGTVRLLPIPIVRRRDWNRISQLTAT